MRTQSGSPCWTVPTPEPAAAAIRTEEVNALWPIRAGEPRESSEPHVLHAPNAISGVRTGWADLDRLMKIDEGLITLRAPSSSWLSRLAARAAVNAYQPNKRMLYLNWLDYHQRYAPLDADYMLALAKKAGVPAQVFREQLTIWRSFGPDAPEREELWKDLLGSKQKFCFAVVDSLSDLYGDDKRKEEEKKPKTFVIGKLGQFALVHSCPVLVLDSAPHQVHPYLAHRSPVVIELFKRAGWWARLIKHPCLCEQEVEIHTDPQRTLGGWQALAFDSQRTLGGWSSQPLVVRARLSPPPLRVFRSGAALPPAPGTAMPPFPKPKPRSWQATLGRSW